MVYYKYDKQPFLTHHPEFFYSLWMPFEDFPIDFIVFLLAKCNFQSI
jgi:hypothetical protein